LWETRIIRLRGADSNCCTLHLCKVAVNVLDTFHMTMAQCSMKRGQCHDGSHDVKSANEDCPLQGTNKQLILGDIIQAKELRVSSSG